MTTLLRRIVVDTSQRVKITISPIGDLFYQDGLAYTTDGAIVCNYGGVVASFNAGIGMTAASELMILDASGGLPGDTVWQSGLPADASEHRLCVDAAGAVSYVHNGIPFTAIGAVAVDTGSGPATDDVRVTDADEDRVTGDGDRRVWV